MVTENTNEPLNRRQFIKILGATSVVASLTMPRYLFANPNASSVNLEGFSGVLVEAVNFTKKGGFTLDSQHFLLMGGAYLLAHGYGEPVKDAKTKVTLKEPGKYKMFVRTRDWCPKGAWKPPGTFKVYVGRTNMGTFGNQNEKWAWQKSSKTISVSKNKKVVVRVKDLTGFDGRFDAIYFTKNDKEKLPNSNTEEVVMWKDAMSQRDKAKIEVLNFDAVIVGGGQTGCAAALAAAKEGIKVALVQNRPVLGGNASEEVRVHTLGIHGKSKDIIKMIDTPHYANGSSSAMGAQAKRTENMQNAKNVSIFTEHIAVALELDNPQGSKKKGKTITSVFVRDVNTGMKKQFIAPVFLDCTGDAHLGYWAGASYSYGREKRSKYNEGWDKHGDIWSPEKSDNRVMGSSLLWNTEKARKTSKFPKSLPWAAPVAKRRVNKRGGWVWEYSDNLVNQITDAEFVRDHMLRAVYGTFSNLIKQPRNANRRLTWVAYVTGKRESRRLMGDYIFTFNDAKKGTKFRDTVVEETRDIDIHYQKKLRGYNVDFISAALFYKVPRYYMPFRSFYSKDVDNLMMGGRCFSCSHVALGGPRVMNTCAQMGVAIGYAAALMKKYSIKTPRELGKKKIKVLKKLIGY